MGYLYFLSFLFALCLSSPHNVLFAQNLPYKVVNLGNWLVVEGWMQEPSLFDGIVSKDLLVLVLLLPNTLLSSLPQVPQGILPLAI